MIFLLLRILIGPLGVFAGSLAQRRLGPAVGGLVIGLPLTFLPLLWLVAAQDGVAFAGSMTNAILVGSITEGLVLWSYVKLMSRFSSVTALVGALVVFAVTVSAVSLLHCSALVAGALTAAGFALALRWWPESAPSERTSTGPSRLAVRVGAATLFTIVIVTMAGVLGSLLAGLIDALPMTTLLMAFMTHREQDSAAASQFVRGVLRGSFSWVISTVVLAEALRGGDVLLAFGLSLVTALLVQAAIQISDSFPAIKRVLTFA